MSILLTITISAVILLFFFFGLIKRKSLPDLSHSMPGILTSVGILGTFLGIYVGLQNFRVHDIENSIPQLLGGLKSAFFTSIVGIIFSIIYKTVISYFEKKESVESQTSDEPIEILKSISEGINRLDESSRETASVIFKVIGSEEEYSLLNQLKLIRSEMVDGRKEIMKSFNDFAEKMAESNTNALIEALEKVMADFNSLLNELVSESFKELSTAMIKLTEWQQNYKDHVEQTQAKINEIIDVMTKASESLKTSATQFEKVDVSLDSIDASLSTMTVSGEDIALHIEHLKSQNIYMEELIKSVKTIGEEAKTVIPAITENINSLTKKIEDTVTTVSEKLDNSGTEITAFVQQSNDIINKSLDTFKETINSSMEQIDKGLEEELTKALNTLAASLASLSTKFAEDYSPITDKLRKIVNMAEIGHA